MSDQQSNTDESIVEQTKKTYKRRSSILQINRRFQDKDITNDETEDNGGNRSTINGENRSFDLPAYIRRLKLERECWRDTLHKQRSRRRNLQKESTVIKKKGADYNLDVLLEAERSFVLGRPAYRDIAKKIQDLGGRAIEVGSLIKKTKALDDRLASLIENKITAAEKKIIEMTREET